MNIGNSQFGPWTTTLHHGSRLELSAFWKGRLRRLSSLALRRSKLTWPSVVMLCWLAIGLLLLPQLRFDSTAQAEEETTHPKTARGTQPDKSPSAPTNSATDPIKAAEQRYRRCTELLASLVKEHGYGLRVDQPLKRLPPPFTKGRDEFWALNVSPELYRDTLAEGPADEARPSERTIEPGFMVLQWIDNELQKQSFHMEEKPLLWDVLGRVFNLRLQDVKGDLSYLKTELPGDWVVSWDSIRKYHVTNPGEIAALEQILRDELKMPVRLKLRDVERPVYVAKGSYNFTPIAGPDGKIEQVSGRVAEKADGEFQIPLHRTNVTGQIVSYQEFLHAIGEVILTPIVDEAAERPKKESLFMRFHSKPSKDYLSPFNEAQIDQVLTSVSKQTGLTFTKDTRPVKTLFIERE